jgi:hypothetical protein
MAKFMLLLYAPENMFQNLSPEEMQKATEKYMDWTKKPFTLDGKRLGDDFGRVIRCSETKEVLGGYYTIEAANYDEAVKLALGNPQLEYGGTIEVRQVYGS